MKIMVYFCLSIESELENRHFTAKISVVLDAESWVHTDFLSSLGCWSEALALENYHWNRADPISTKGRNGGGGRPRGSTPYYVYALVHVVLRASSPHECIVRALSLDHKNSVPIK